MKISWEKPKEIDGILVAFDKTMQPFLLWWFNTLRKFTSKPVCFISLGGISKNVKNWCENHGYFYENEKYVLNFKKIKIPIKSKKKWSNQILGDVTDIRPYWFTKPIAMMHTPFEKTLYLDIDCEIKSSIDEIFSYLNGNEIALCKDISEFNHFNNKYFNNKKDQNKILFNSGVIIYKSKSKIIEKWAELSLNFSHDFLGDQDLLSNIIYKYKYKPTMLPIYWNWNASMKEDKKTKIYHWSGNNKLKLLEKIKNDKKLTEDMKKLLN